MKKVCLQLLLMVSVVGLKAAEIPALRGLSRTHLLEYRDEAGKLKTATTVAEWEVRRKAAVAAFLSMTGPLPGEVMRCPLDLRVEEEVDCGSYVRRLISYASSPGGRVPAYLCIPKAALMGKPAPAVLCLHPTENVIGHKVVVGLGGKPHRQYAAELAERGYVTLAPSYPLLAQYQPDLKALGFTSGTMKAIWDNIRGLDLLETMPFVKKDAGFATIGHSLGGHNSIFTAVLEPRLKAVVSSCGFDSVLDYKDGNIKGWVQERYILKMGDYLGRPQDVPFDYYELIACLAPRALYVNAPLKDSNFKWDSVDRIAAAAEAVYKLHGAEEGMIIRHPDCDHDFPDDERYESYGVIEKVLGKP
ncbi:dienelactone hydrolase family protein [Prosthecobacter dejongeii]|uniref:Dienelactone hydrolase n=1 Tax=Prosthecobacter dejongeii TaxID=48465 RepID=A0A7W8DNJ6_9BACT|nr:alpha/beta hydrolase [Prosthecobacter dejongeii]MBB5035991.1 dienelactone hydrolase [Prosthecobacter dejongeii]